MEIGLGSVVAHVSYRAGSERYHRVDPLFGSDPSNSVPVAMGGAVTHDISYDGVEPEGC